MVLIFITQALSVMIMILLGVAFFSLFERKMMGFMQIRKGPSKLMIMGFLQPIADAMKLLTKNSSPPTSSPPIIYSFIPPMFMCVALCYWVPLPMKGNWLILQSGVLFIVFWMSVSVYMIIFIGWFSNSKYSLIGGVRSVIQTISYEIVLSFGLLCFCLMSYSVYLNDMLKFQLLTWFILPLLPMTIPMVISFLAESNRTPFDLTEGESELVSGFCVEYGGLPYTLIFLSENASILFMAVLFSILFTKSSWLIIMLMVSMFVWIRATLPRIRFDKLMLTCWINMLPAIMSVMMAVISLKCTKSLMFKMLR